MSSFQLRPIHKVVNLREIYMMLEFQQNLEITKDLEMVSSLQ